MCMVSCIANIKDHSFENKLRLEQTIKTMLIGMSEANRDGTGIAFATTDGRVFMTKSRKAGGHVANQFSLDPDIDYKHIILHTRMATMGAADDVNAHPHETNFGYLVHNGWCPSLYYQLKAQMKTGCDTEALAHIYHPDPAVFEKGLLGSEHFAIIHLDADGSNVTVMNKNKLLYKCFSKTLNAEIFLTSSSVIKDVGTLIGEELDYKMVHDGDVYTLDGNTIRGTRFRFADSGYASWGNYGWPEDSPSINSDSQDHFLKKYMEHEKRERMPAKPIYYNRKKNRDDAIPEHVFRMTRKERKRWIRENKEKRDEYVQFWADHETELRQQESQENDLRQDGFMILDADGNLIDE